ncbi:hypothetical protein TWF506_010510 [Arthrobotrys conoides]|uniref:Uncharacterized protein n=1 Tax=Arthrobotrys conoides TaxID=74498 RepID=A0AAN8NHJ4_9PEZI
MHFSLSLIPLVALVGSTIATAPAVTPLAKLDKRQVLLMPANNAGCPSTLVIGLRVILPVDLDFIRFMSTTTSTRSHTLDCGFQSGCTRGKILTAQAVYDFRNNNNS